MFKLEAARVAGQRSVLSHNPMARDHNGNWILMIGHSDGPRGTRLPQCPGNVSVRSRVSVRNLQQFFPNGDLERSPSEIQRHIELCSITLKVFIELLDEYLVGRDVHNTVLWDAAAKTD